MGSRACGLGECSGDRSGRGGYACGSGDVADVGDLVGPVREGLQDDPGAGVVDGQALIRFLFIA